MIKFPSPFELVDILIRKTRLQIHGELSAAKRLTLWQTVSMMYKTEGIRSFYKGDCYFRF